MAAASDAAEVDMIGTWMRMAMLGGLGAASASAVAAGVAAPVALQAATSVDAPDAPDDEAPDEHSCGKKPKQEHDNLGAQVRAWHDEGLHGRELAAEIHAHHPSHRR